MLTQEEFETLHYNLWSDVRYGILRDWENGILEELSNPYGLDDYKRTVLNSMSNLEPVKRLTNEEKAVLKKYRSFACLVSWQKAGSHPGNKYCHCEYCPINWGDVFNWEDVFKADGQEGYYCEREKNPYSCEEVDVKLEEAIKDKDEDLLEKVLDMCETISEYPVKEELFSEYLSHVIP